MNLYIYIYILYYHNSEGFRVRGPAGFLSATIGKPLEGCVFVYKGPMLLGAICDREAHQGSVEL